MSHKVGLDYFPFDIDFFQDEKIEYVSARFGVKGEIIAIRLLCKIYRQGYYLDWNEDAALLLAKGVGDGCQHSCVRDVVYELLKRGFFDKSIFERFSILTSKGIQRRYFDAMNRRKKVYCNADYLLVELPKYKNVDIIYVNVDIPEKNVDIQKQSKVEESKEKESNYPPLPPPAENLDGETDIATNDGASALAATTNDGDDPPLETATNVDAVKSLAKRRKKKKVTPDPNKTQYAEFVSMTNGEYSSLVTKLGSVELADRCIEILDNYKGANGVEYLSDYRAILGWVIKRLEKDIREEIRYSKNSKQQGMVDLEYWSDDT